MGDLREPNGVVLEESRPSSPPSSSFRAEEVWARAEQATQEIIRQVQPTVVSEGRRKDVIDYVQRLLKHTLGCEVFPFGSVPLKTYLPDGDIDLTAFCAFNVEESFANDVYSVLEREDHNPVAEFVIKDVQYIRAEVKLVKCLVQNIVVDISFNQLGGLCALCFLEEVDRLIGREHLFKRSIILIKAWCYYESRILGAHHGLISTYALEILVLHIFHLFHSSLGGPLAVLYKFLDYYSKFDWDNYCVSLNGPVPVSSLPEIVAEKPDDEGGDLLLGDGFLRECVKKFSVPSRGTETNPRTFMQKHLNIVDPLKENNNLGRSVSKGNFFRIRSAFIFGARKLGQILLQPQENITEEVRRFFTNTLDRHGQGQRPDVQDFLPVSGSNGSFPDLQYTGGEPSQEESSAHEVESVNCNDLSNEYRVGFEDTRHVVVSNVREAGTCPEESGFEHQRGIKKSIPYAALSAADSFLSTSTCRLSGDANELATWGIQDLSRTSDAVKSSPLAEESKIPLDCVSHAPYPYILEQLENREMENGDLYENGHTYSSSTDRKIFSGRHHVCHEDNFTSWKHENGHSCYNHDLSTSKDFSPMSSDACCVQDSHFVYCDARSFKAGGSHETLNLLPDLSGDVDSHLDSLQYGRWWYDGDHFFPTSLQPNHLAFPLFQRHNGWDTIQQPVPFRQTMASQLNGNGVVPNLAFFPLIPPVVAGAAFLDEMPKTRGTGTYFPITNHQSYRDRSSQAKGRTQGPLKSPHTNGRASAPFDRCPQAQSPVRQGVGKPRCWDSLETFPRGKVSKEMNGYLHNSDKANEFGEVGCPPIETLLLERDNNRASDLSTPRSQNGEPVFVVNHHDRLAVLSYRLKDDGDFPPLSA